MTDHPTNDEPAFGGDPHDDADLEEVARALGYDDTREPSDERVAAVRRAAARLRADRESAGTADGTTPGTGSRDRRTLLVGVAAASAGVLGGIAAGTRLDAEPSKPGVPTEELALTGIPAGVSAAARLINHTWGTEVLLDVRDLPPGNVYRVGLVTSAGTVEAGSFLSVRGVLMVCRFNAAPLRADVRAVVVRGPRQEVVMRADLT